MNHPHWLGFARTAICAAAAVVVAAPALAQDATAVTLRPVVVTGSRIEAESFDLPYSVDSVDMRANQAGNLGVNASEALAGVPGVRGAFGQASSATPRCAAPSIALNDGSSISLSALNGTLKRLAVRAAVEVLLHQRA